jgi:inosine/xanthosine triphosphate pyrophosphatase family protein
MARFSLGIVVCVLVVISTARPQQEKKGKPRVFEGKVSDEDHFKEEEHNSEYDHEAFLGEEKKTFDQLTTEESKERLG